MDNALTRKLERFGPLADDDRALIAETVAVSRLVRAGGAICREGDDPTVVHLVLEGMAFRYKDLADGGRQIIAYMLPGDYCDLHVFMLAAMDHGLAAMSTCRIVDIPARRIDEMLARPGLARSLWWAALIDAAILRNWIVNIGGRPPEQRLANFFCEITMRLQAVGLATLKGCQIPLTQADLADTMGISLVHANRSLQSLRAKGLITLRRTRFEILDFDRLAAFCDFDAVYLHLTERDPAPVPAAARAHDLTPVAGE